MADRIIKQVEIRYSESGQREVIRGLQGTADAAGKASQATDRLGDSQEKSGRKVGTLERQLGTLQRTVDGAYRAEVKYADAQRTVERAIGNRLITETRGNEILELTRKKYSYVEQAAAFANDNVRLTGNQVTNLGYQLNDVGTMLASGASPFQVIATQSGQVVQALSDGPGGIRGSLKAIGAELLGFAARIGPVGWGLAAAAAAVGGFALAFRKSVPDMEKTLSKHEGLLERIGSQYDGLKDRLEAIGKASRSAFNVEAGAVGRDLQTLTQEQGKALQRDFSGDYWFYGGMDPADAATTEKFAPIRAEVDAFRKALAAGNGDVDAFRQQLSDMYAAAGDNAELKKAIEGAFQLTDVMADLARRARENKAAIQEMDPAYQRAAQGMQAYRGALEELKGFIPDERKPAQQIEDAFARATMGPSLLSAKQLMELTIVKAEALRAVNAQSVCETADTAADRRRLAAVAAEALQ